MARLGTDEERGYRSYARRRCQQKESGPAAIEVRDLAGQQRTRALAGIRLGRVGSDVAECRSQARRTGLDETAEKNTAEVARRRDSENGARRAGSEITTINPNGLRKWLPCSANAIRIEMIQINKNPLD